MVKIEIEIPYPFSTAVTLLGIVSAILWVVTSGAESAPVVQADATGGSDQIAQMDIKREEENMKRIRGQQELLNHREEILRYQLKKMEEQSALMAPKSSDLMMEEYYRGVRVLTDLLYDQKRAEQKLLESLREMWEAEQRALVIASDEQSSRPIALMWPVEPIYGVSAGFLDESYQEHFGIPHNAIDIPALQGTVISAAADGVVEEYVDNGLGYSWMVVRHDGFVTVYGHITEALVHPGDAVWVGDPIAKSGGLPGSRGAGNLSTGPHLHFEVVTDGGHVNPLRYLPQVPTVEEE